MIPKILIALFGAPGQWKGKKTLLSAVLIALGAVFPPAQAWVAANPDTFMTLVAFVMTLLRMVTDSPVVQGNVIPEAAGEFAASASAKKNVDE